MDLISVIVPVYKVEKYLDRCVESIVNQTYKNLEIILVDDGSPDSCPIMCDEWAKRDSRIKVIHKKNGGGGEARNVALDIAKGEFISLIDSDDYIESHMFEHLMGLMSEEIDIAECGIIATDTDCAVLDNGDSFVHTVYTTQDAMALHIEDKLFCQTPPNKIYRRNVIGDIRFPVGNRIDDEFWTYRVIANSRKLVRTSCSMYAYRQQPDSVMHKSFSISRLQAVEAKSQRIMLIEKKFPQLVAIAKINLWYTCLYMGQMSILHICREERERAFRILNDTISCYPLFCNEIKRLPLKQKVWAYFSKISFIATCKLRNYLHIGI